MHFHFIGYIRWGWKPNWLVFSCSTSDARRPDESARGRCDGEEELEPCGLPMSREILFLTSTSSFGWEEPGPVKVMRPWDFTTGVDSISWLSSWPRVCAENVANDIWAACWMVRCRANSVLSASWSPYVSPL